MNVQTLFDLRVGVFSATDSLEAIVSAESSEAIHMLKVIEPSPVQISGLVERGYVLKPQYVEYALNLKAPNGFSSVEGFLSAVPASRRQRAKRVYQEAERLQKAGQLQLVVDREGNADDLQAFVALHTQVMSDRVRGRQVLKDRLADLGSLSQLHQQMPLAIYLKVGDALRGGLLAYDLPEGYSIGFCVCDGSFQVDLKSAQLLLVLTALRLSLDEGRQTLLYGTDTNFYGHHLNIGLLEYKRSLLFEPRPKGCNELIKVVDWNFFQMPLAFFQFDEQGGAVLNIMSRNDNELLDPTIRSVRVRVRTPRPAVS